MNEKIHIPDLEEVESLDETSARAQLKQLVMLISTLYALIESLQAQLEELSHQNGQLQRRLFGPTSEKVIPVQSQLQKKKRKNETPEEAARRKEKARKKREENAEKRREALETEVLEHPVEEQACPDCGAAVEETAELGSETRVQFEYVPARLVRREFHIEKRVCNCGSFLCGAPVERVGDAVLYGPGLHAHVVVQKCADSIPIYRQAKQFRRVDIPMNRSTLNELFHRSAELLCPIYRRMREKLAAEANVCADETQIKVQETGKCRKAWIWTFIGGPYVAYVYSPSRSGETPMEVLGQSPGTLTVDGYTGYNSVTTPEGRVRTGCWAHARRKFFEAAQTAPEAQHVIDEILNIYEVEYEAAEKQIIGTEDHRLLRQAKTKPVVEGLFAWLEEQKQCHLPKGPMGKAISYALNQREALEVFLERPKVAVDNNISERHLRLIALGRKNFLFVGHDQAGENLAVLQSLVASCIANKVNPQDYLTDVLMRIQDHPHSAIDELLPDQWRPPD